MTEADPERLLAEALRAQATRAPAPEPQPGTVGGYGLLSGSDYADPAPGPPEPVEATARLAVAESPRAWWVLLVAALLGVAAGAVVGLLTLI